MDIYILSGVWPCMDENTYNPKAIGLHAQNMLTIPGSIVTWFGCKGGGELCDHLMNSHFDIDTS